LENDTLVVAGGGGVYVFQRESDTWSQTQKLTASDGVSGDSFGGAISLSGRTLVIGASHATINGQLYQGAAYVFVRANGSWREVQKLTSSDGVAFDTFGSAVAVHGRIIVVGAPNKDVDKDNFITGEAYVFARATGTWNQTQTLVASDSGLFAAFGFSVALSGNTALIGAPHATANGHAAQGAVYTFAVANGILTETQMITSDDGASNDTFGSSVALSGRRALIGAFSAVNPNGSKGEVYPFRQVGGSWSQVGRITASDGTSLQSFGFTVALDQDALLVGNSSYLDSGAYFYSPRVE
jgi:FG-GAP repeat protein